MTQTSKIKELMSQFVLPLALVWVDPRAGGVVRLRFRRPEAAVKRPGPVMFGSAAARYDAILCAG